MDYSWTNNSHLNGSWNTEIENPSVKCTHCQNKTIVVQEATNFKAPTESRKPDTDYYWRHMSRKVKAEFKSIYTVALELSLTLQGNNCSEWTEQKVLSKNNTTDRDDEDGSVFMVLSFQYFTEKIVKTWNQVPPLDFPQYLQTFHILGDHIWILWNPFIILLLNQEACSKQHQYCVAMFIFDCQSSSGSLALAQNKTYPADVERIIEVFSLSH